MGKIFAAIGSSKRFTAALLIAALLVYRQLSFLLTTQPIDGFDLTPHYHLYLQMRALLGEGRLSGFDPWWYAGYPAFTLYPPLAYILLALPDALALGALGANASFNLALFVLPFVFAACFMTAVCSIFGRRTRYFALAMALAFLFEARRYSSIGIGLISFIDAGLIANLVGLCFLLALWTRAEAAIRAPSLRNAVFGAVLLAALIVTHTITAVFMLWLLTSYLFAVTGRARGSLLAMILGGLVLAAPWEWRAIEALDLSSGQLLGLPDGLYDPLFVLFPLGTPGDIAAMLQSAWAFALDPELPSFVRVPVALFNLVVNLPWLGVIITAGTVAALIDFFRRREWRLPAVYLISLLVLPRNLLGALLPVSLHYYRFIAPLFIFTLFFAAHGLTLLWERAPRRRAALGGFAILAVLCAWYRLDLGYPSSTLVYHGLRSRYPARAAADSVMRYLAAHAGSGRVLSENPLTDMRALGSPHYFASLLPDEYGVATANGLLVESSLSAGYLNPAAFKSSRHLRWGHAELWGRRAFRRQSLQTMLKRFGLFHVKYVVSASRRYRRALLNARSRASFEFASGEYHVFRVRRARPLLEASNYHPFLFVNEGGMPFREFSEAWYTEPALFTRPVVYTQRPWIDLPPGERDRFGGIIVSRDRGERVSGADLERWRATGKRVLVVGAMPTAELLKAAGADISFLPNFPSRASERRLARLLRRRQPRVVRHGLTLRSSSPETLEFKARSGVLVGYSFAPRWTCEPSCTVYWATPSLMWVFGNGEVRLRYR